MNWLQIANCLDKSPANSEWVDISEIGLQFNINMNIDYIEQDRLTCYWVSSWRCIETCVGTRLYFLDEKPVAYSYQLTRMSKKIFCWFSLEDAESVRKYLFTLNGKEESLKPLNLDIGDINEDVDSFYKINYNSQIISKNIPYYNGEEVEIVKKHKGNICRTLTIKLSDESLKVVNIKELDFKIHTNDIDNTSVAIKAEQNKIVERMYDMDNNYKFVDECHKTIHKVISPNRVIPEKIKS